MKIPFILVKGIFGVTCGIKQCRVTKIIYAKEAEYCSFLHFNDIAGSGPLNVQARLGDAAHNFFSPAIPICRSSHCSEHSQHSLDEQLTLIDQIILQNCSQSTYL